MSEKSLITLHFIEDDFIHSFLETSTKRIFKILQKARSETAYADSRCDNAEYRTDIRPYQRPQKLS